MTRPEGRWNLRRRVEQGLWITGAILLGSCLVTIVEAGAYQAWHGWRLGGLFGGTAAGVRGEVEATGLIGRIAVDRIGLSAIVAEGVNSSVLRRAVGHMPGTPFPGERGNAVLAGHRDTFFRKLQDIRQGDTIRMAIPDGEFDYVVESTRVVTPDHVELLEPTSAPTLTLITCYPFRYIGRAPQRFVVRASLAGPRWVSDSAGSGSAGSGSASGDRRIVVGHEQQDVPADEEQHRQLGDGGGGSAGDPGL